MPYHSDDNVLVNLSTPIYPDPDQEQRLTGWHAALIQVDQALCQPGTRISVEDALERYAPGLPVDMRPALVRVFHKRIGHKGESSIGIPFDALLSPAPPYLLHSPVLPGPVIADLWRLPLGLDVALSKAAAVTSAGLNAEVRRLHQADAAGDLRALKSLHDLIVRRGQQTTSSPSPLSGVSSINRSLPHLGTHATVWRERLPDGEVGWWVRWTIRVQPDWLPAATNPDPVGVDVGVRRAITWADGHTSGHLCASRHPGSGWRPSAPTASFDHRLADAHLRHAVFGRLARPLDQTLRHLLTYQTIALEATRWEDLVRKDLQGPAVVRAMTLTGVTALAPWIRALGRVTGSRVHSAPPEGSSITCHVSDHVGLRRGVEFSCAACGLVADADVNAALNHRLWALGHRRDLRVKRQ